MPLRHFFPDILKSLIWGFEAQKVKVGSATRVTILRDFVKILQVKMHDDVRFALVRRLVQPISLSEFEFREAFNHGFKFLKRFTSQMCNGSSTWTRLSGPAECGTTGCRKLLHPLLEISDTHVSALINRCIYLQPELNRLLDGIRDFIFFPLIFKESVIEIGNCWRIETPLHCSGWFWLRKDSFDAKCCIDFWKCNASTYFACCKHNILWFGTLCTRSILRMLTKFDGG